jgi:hypothetical protein
MLILREAYLELIEELRKPEENITPVQYAQVLSLDFPEYSYQYDLDSLD